MNRLALHHILRQFAPNSLKPGQILSLDTPHIQHRDDKYFVFAADSERPLLFYINSRMAPLARSNPDIRVTQIPISPKDYAFLTHRSYIDTCNVCTEYTRQDILGQIRRDTTRVIGPLLSETRLAVLRAVQESPTIEARHIKAITASLTD